MEETILSYKDLEVARVPFYYICENYSFSLIYADFQLITNNLVLTTDN